MTPKRFHSILVSTTIGTNRKLRRLKPDERWAAVAGVWALAAESCERGYLLIAEHVQVEAQDIAEHAGVTVAVARSTLKKMRELGMLEQDEDGVEYVHDWHLHQSEPKDKPSDSKDARRERKRRQRERDNTDGHAEVTRVTAIPVTQGHEPPREGKGREGKSDPPVPPKGGRARDKERFEEEFQAFASSVLPHLPEEGAYYGAKEAFTMLRNRGSLRPSREQVLGYLRENRPDLMEAAA